jgi:NAD(P)-dependent dehydrogenase (short-subunit alcohol dehydrogenase family)
MKILSFSDLNGKVCVITGGAGIIGKSLCQGLASAGVNIAIIDLVKSAADSLAADLRKDFNIRSIGVEGNVLDKESLMKAKQEINTALGPIDILINCAGGNNPKATTKDEFVNKDGSNLEQSFYGLDIEGFRKVFDLNFLGTILPTMVFSTDMVKKGGGSVLNISSMNGFRPLTKIPAYSAAKSSINNFTEWLAVHLAKTNIRVNAIAPGFFLTDQNRFLLTDEKTGELTARGHKILSGTPMGKFGEPDDLQGAALYLLSDISKFVTGIIIPVDGGFNAYSGV